MGVPLKFFAAPSLSQETQKTTTSTIRPVEVLAMVPMIGLPIGNIQTNIFSFRDFFRDACAPVPKSLKTFENH